MAEANDASASAYQELLALLRELDERFLGPDFGNTAPEDISDGRQFFLHALHGALNSQLDADPTQPRLHRILSPSIKILGDNPDAIYFGAHLRPDLRYRVRGNLAAATFTSFSQEIGVEDGGYSRGTVNVIRDVELPVDADGNYEFILSREREPGAWFPLHPQAALLNTRHFFERETSAASDPTLHVPLSIECLDKVAQPVPRADDAAVAARIRSISTYLRGLTFDVPPVPMGPQPAWVSMVPNRFNPPEQPATETGWANMDASYAMAPYELQPGEALLVTGRFPVCRFANVVLFNRFLQTFDYTHRRVSLNRRQMVLRSDGSFRIVLADRDPGVPNWLDVAGYPKGRMFWRFLLPEEALQPFEARVVPIDQVARET